MLSGGATRYIASKHSARSLANVRLLVHKNKIPFNLLQAAFHFIIAPIRETIETGKYSMRALFF